MRDTHYHALQRATRLADFPSLTRPPASHRRRSRGADGNFGDILNNRDDRPPFVRAAALGAVARPHTC